MYERVEDLLALAIRMQGSAEGVSIADIEVQFGVGRRTAERMRDAVARVFGGLDTRASDDRRIRWALPPNRVGLLSFNAEELAELHAAAALLRRDGRDAAAATIDGIADKLRATFGAAGIRRVEPDLEALIEADGLAMRPGPRLRIDGWMLSTLRSAILKCHKVRIRYRGRNSRAIGWHRLCPYGFLYGTRPYLVAFSLNPQVLDYRTYQSPAFSRSAPPTSRSRAVPIFRSTPSPAARSACSRKSPLMSSGGSSPKRRQTRANGSSTPISSPRISRTAR